MATASKSGKKKKKPQPLDEGDRIEYGLTFEIEVEGRSAWPKFGAATRQRPGESTAAALRRLQTFVEDTLNDKIEEIVG